MPDVFTTYSHFIDSDPRSNRQEGYGYRPTVDFSIKRLSLLLPVDVCKGKSILDLGSCVGASGAYALYNSAEKYVGVEQDSELYRISSDNFLRTDFQNYDIVHSTVEHFLKNNKEKFDIVLCMGILHVFDNPFEYWRLIAKCAKNTILVDQHHPYIEQLDNLDESIKKLFLKKNVLTNFFEKEQFFSVKPVVNYMLNQTIAPVCLEPSMAVINNFFKLEGFKSAVDLNTEAKKILPDEYARRFMIRLDKNDLEI